MWASSSASRCRASCIWVVKSSSAAAAAAGEGGLEVGRGLGGLGALLLVDGFGLLEPGGRVTLGGVEPVVGGALRVLEHAGGLGVGVGAGLVGVLVGLAALARHLVGDLLPLLVEQGPAPLEQVAGLVLGEAEDPGHPLAQVLERRRAPRASLASWPCCSSSADALGQLLGVGPGLLGLLRRAAACAGRPVRLVAAEDHPEEAGGSRSWSCFLLLGGGSAGPSVGTARAWMTPESLSSSAAISSRRLVRTAASGRASSRTARALLRSSSASARAAAEVLGGLLPGLPQLVLSGCRLRTTSSATCWRSSRVVDSVSSSRRRARSWMRLTSSSAAATRAARPPRRRRGCVRRRSRRRRPGRRRRRSAPGPLLRVGHSARIRSVTRCTTSWSRAGWRPGDARRRRGRPTAAARPPARRWRAAPAWSAASRRSAPRRPRSLRGLGAGGAEHLLGRGVRVGADLLGVAEHAVCVGVAFLRSASASCAASARTAAASSSAEIRSSSAARTVSSCCAASSPWP